MTVRSHGIPPVKGGQGREHAAVGFAAAVFVCALFGAGLVCGIAIGWAVWA